jgi:hypothetical protein
VKPPSPTIDLVCSVLLTSGEGWVKMPVAREIWESGEAREFLIQKVREELVSVAVRDPDVDPEPPAAPAVCEVVCVGGPRDGSRVKLNRAHPGLLVLLPREPSLTDLFDAADGVLEPSRHLHYVPIVDDEGHFSRADDGAWRFRYDGAR